MEISIADQIALDDALVAPANRLKIGKCNLRLSSDVTSKEATLQVVYDVLKLTPFYRHSSFAIGKPSYDCLRLSQAQILRGMYNNKNVDYAYLLWEDFIYQIENKNTKKGIAIYYPRFTKLVVNFVMDKTSIPSKKTKVNLAYARDDHRLQHNNVIFKEYYAIASGKIPPKTKGSKKKADTDTTTKQKSPTIPKEKKEKKSGKGKQKAKEYDILEIQVKLIKKMYIHDVDEKDQDDDNDDKN
ncbi:hypothetical protein Tco_0697740 [Tanacetum coccineum]